MPDEAQPAPLNLEEALDRDSLESLKREKAELAERLAAADAKECPSCRASFEGGIGVPEDADGKKPKAAKKKAAKKTGSEKGSDAETPKAGQADQAAEVQADDDGDGFGFF